jgi:pyruvate,water dikinase
MSPETTAYALPLTAPAATQTEIAGGKGAMLARLFQAGLPVPSGCILTAPALTFYLGAQHEPPLQNPIPIELQVALRDVLDALGSTPSGWAVRSSAVAEDSDTASFAGIYDSLLNVEETQLWDAIRSCWSSWWSDRARAYRQRLGLPHVPHMAVVIQHMVPAQCAGVAFTVDPISGDTTQMVVNAASGLGIDVVSGVVEPEQYWLSKTPDVRVLNTRLHPAATRPLLTAEMTAGLGAQLLRIETLCGTPQDVEWAWDGEQCWIVQSRPITTVGQQTTDQHTAHGPDVWTNANLKDVLPGLISPLSWSIVGTQLDDAIRIQYARRDYTWPVQRQAARRFWGRIYFNMSLFQQAAYEVYGAPSEDLIAHLGGPKVQGFTPPQSPGWRMRWRWLRNIVAAMRFFKHLYREVPGRFAELYQYYQEERQHIPQLDREALIQALLTRAETNLPFLVFHLDLNAALNAYLTILRQLMQRYLPEAEGSRFADLVTGLGEVHSADHSYRLWELSRLARQMPEVMTFLVRRDWRDWREALAPTEWAAPWQAFLDTYGHRGLYEVDVANPRWREQPDYLFDMLAAYAALAQDTPPFNPQRQTQRRQHAEAATLGQMPFWLRPWCRHALRRTQAFSRYREQSKSHLVRLIDLARQVCLRAGDILVQAGLLDERDAVFFLERDDLVAALHGEVDRTFIQHRVAQRRLERRRYAALQPPDAIVGDRPVYETGLSDHGRVLSGLPSSPGRVVGTARILRTPQDSPRLQAGDILVAPSTDPGWTPLFLLAAGLVMETGGYLSHGAIVAREYGIPAVLNVPLALQRIPDGATITLDGAAGTIQLADPTSTC